MNEENETLSADLVPALYVRQGCQSLRSRSNLLKQLLSQRRLPDHGWDDATIELVLAELSMMDSNNFLGNVGAGEREGRVYSSIVARRHFRLIHGVGRSGDIAAMQPKAAGSSLMARLTRYLALDLLKLSGAPATEACLVLPVATGMSLVLTLLTMKQTERGRKARYVIWPRIDQKSCLKAILTAGCEPIVVENVLVGDELQTDVGAVRREVERVGVDQVLCVLTTTSCFAPRIPDKIIEVSELCSEVGIGHVVNNAYGVQSGRCMELVRDGARRGRVDAYVQSTDKNFMVPVGGAVVAGFDRAFIDAVGKCYPGRASATPSIDVFVTLLSMGRDGWRGLLTQRKKVFVYLREKMVSVASTMGERLLETRGNPISLAMTLESVPRESASQFGAMLFSRNVSGARVVSSLDTKEVGGICFDGYGAHYTGYPCAYLTVAAAVGMAMTDVDDLADRLLKTMREFRKRLVRQAEERELATTTTATYTTGEHENHDHDLENDLI